MGFEEWRSWARIVKRDVVALWFAARDTRTPWFAKVAAAAVAAYALSPIDLIPDFIPIVGYLDDMLIVPLGILITIRMIPPELMVEFRGKADEAESRPVSRGVVAFVVLLWVGCGIWLAWQIAKMAQTWNYWMA